MGFGDPIDFVRSAYWWICCAIIILVWFFSRFYRVDPNIFFCQLCTNRVDFKPTLSTKNGSRTRRVGFCRKRESTPFTEPNGFLQNDVTHGCDGSKAVNVSVAHRCIGGRNSNDNVLDAVDSSDQRWWFASDGSKWDRLLENDNSPSIINDRDNSGYFLMPDIHWYSIIEFSGRELS